MIVLKRIKYLLKYFGLHLFSLLNKVYFTWLMNKHKGHIHNRNNIVKQLEGNRILIFSPHVDDDMIGCGGAIQSYLKGGKEVSVLYLTKGNKSKQDVYDTEILVEERRKEAFQVAELIGISQENLFFLEANDQELSAYDAQSKLQYLFDKFKPDVLFLPVLLDTHIDHFATTLKLIEYIRNSGFGEPLPETLYLYEVQSPITPFYSNTILDITSHVQKKDEAMRLFKTQSMDFNFVQSTGKINAIASGDHLYSEIFIKTNIRNYYKFFKENFKSTLNHDDIKKQLVPHSNHISSIKAYSSSIKNKKILEEIINIDPAG